MVDRNVFGKEKMKALHQIVVVFFYINFIFLLNAITLCISALNSSKSHE